MQPPAFRRTLALVSLVAAPAGAQIMSNPAQWYIDTQMYSTRVFNDAVANSMITKGARGTAAGKPNAPAAAEPTRFREGTGASITEALARRTGGDAARQAAAKRTFDSYVALYRQTAQKDGFPSNDLAYAYEYFVVNNYQIYHDLFDVPYEKDPWAKRGRDGFDRITLMNQKKLQQVTMPQERAIYEQFRASLGANPEIRKLTDAQKQEAAEQLAIMFGVNYSAYLRAVNAEDDAAAEQARRMARQGLEKLLGASFERIKVTDAGVTF
jgi:hypothetical protein